MTPRDQTSTLFEIIVCVVLKHSGAWYQYVPTPVEVNSTLSLFSSTCLQRPKSVIQTSPWWKRIFWGFKSKWMILDFYSSIYLRPCRIWMIINLASLSGNYYHSFKYCDKSGPLHSSRIVQNVFSSISIVLKCHTILWWSKSLWISVSQIAYLI